MSINSVNKRISAINVGLPVRFLPPADADMDRRDRQALAQLYALYSDVLIIPAAAIAIGSVIAPVVLRRFAYLRDAFVRFDQATRGEVDFDSATVAEIDFDQPVRAEIEFD